MESKAGFFFVAHLRENWTVLRTANFGIAPLYPNFTPGNLVGFLSNVNHEKVISLYLAGDLSFSLYRYKCMHGFTLFTVRFPHIHDDPCMETSQHSQGV